MATALVFILVIGGVVGFMYLLLKVCMLTSGDGKSKASKSPAGAAKVDAAKVR